MELGAFRITIGTMSDTEKAIKPLSLVTFIFGCGILRYPLGQPRYRLSIVYILIVWSVYACVLYYIQIQFHMTKHSFLSSFLIIINLFVTMISIIITVRKHENFYICIKKLDLVNDTLEELGMLKEYHRLRNLIKWALIMLMFMTCISWIFDSLLCLKYYNDTKAIIIPMIMDYSLQINTVMDIKFMLLLRHIGFSMDKINDHIVQLSEIEDCGLRCKWKKCIFVSSYIRNTENRQRVLWTIMHLHLELCRTARDINNFFGIQMTLQMLSYFVILIGMFNFEYYTILHHKIMYEDNVILNVLLCTNTWFIIFLIKLISLNHICESVSAKARKTTDVIHRLTNLICFVDVREEISQFVLQISLRPLKFSGLGLFYFGYDFIRKFFVWMITAVLFMVQKDIVPINDIVDKYLIKHNLTYYNQK